jgi:hypothetical protein
MTTRSRRVVAALGGIAISITVGFVVGIDYDHPLGTRLLYGAVASFAAVTAWVAIVWTLLRVRPHE